MIQIQAETLNGIKTQALADLEDRSKLCIKGGENMYKIGPVVNEVLKDLVNKTIEREYQIVGENYMDNLKVVPELLKRDRELSDKMIDVLDQLSKVVPKEYNYLIDEVENVSVLMIGVESRLYFRKGLLLGLTELKYLGKVVEEIAYF